MPQVTFNSLPAPFVVNPRLTGLVIAYRNKNYIADDVAPRVSVETPTYNYSKFGKEQFLTPESSGPIGRKGAVPEIETKADQISASVEDYGFDDVVPVRDQLASMNGVAIDPTAVAAIAIQEKIDLNREIRLANKVSATANYDAGNFTTLAGTSQWSDFANSDPLNSLQDAIDSMFVRPNFAWCGRLVASKLRRHPKIVQAYNGSEGQYGMVPLEYIANLLGLDQILVGESMSNTAAKGQAGSFAPVWGKHFGLFYRAPFVVNLDTPTFAATAEWGGRVTGTYFDEKIGLRGSNVMRVGESVGEQIIAPDMGYLFRNAIA